MKRMHYAAQTRHIRDKIIDAQVRRLEAAQRKLKAKASA